MSWDREHRCPTAGTSGEGTHLGDPLTADQVRALPDGAEIVVTWSGGNGPWPYRVLVDHRGDRHVETCYADPLLDGVGDRQRLFHRVTLGWDDASRAWQDTKIPAAAHIRAMWHQMRTGER